MTREKALKASRILTTLELFELDIAEMLEKIVDQPHFDGGSSYGKLRPSFKEALKKLLNDEHESLLKELESI